jgi:hypothetical protein
MKPSISRLPASLWLLTMTMLLTIVGLEVAIRTASRYGQLDNTLGSILISLAAMSTVGALIISRQPGNRMAWIFIGAAFAFSVDQLAAQYGVLALLARPGEFPAGIWAAWVSDVLWVPSVVGTIVFVPLLFPDGQPLSRRWRGLAWLAAALTVWLLVMAAVHTGALSDPFGRFRSPVGNADDGWVDSAAAVAFVSLLACWPAALVSLVLRARRAGPIERAQIRWFMYAAVLTLPTFLLHGAIHGSLSSPVARLGSDLAFALAIVGLPVSVGIAVLRYRLYELDVIVRRTLGYAMLVVALALLYLTGIVIIGVVVRGVAGRSDTFAVALSTLGVTAAFQPLRSRIQRAVDRRFYRRQYDAQAVVEGFSGRLREEINLDALAAELIAAVEQAVAPADASLWLRPPRPATSKERPGSASTLVT